jgi:iron-sulfur cluster assembly protein
MMTIRNDKFMGAEPSGGNASSSAKPMPSIHLTDTAVAEIRRRLSLEKDSAGKMLRLWVEAGGCSGLSYEMEFVSEKKATDVAFEFNGLPVLVEDRSMSYINGMTLDFSSKMVNGGFQFSNPKAKRSCGCGTSFSV